MVKVNDGYAIVHGEIILMPTIRPNKKASIEAYMKMFPDENYEEVEKTCRKVRTTIITGEDLVPPLRDPSDTSVITGC